MQSLGGGFSSGSSNNGSLSTVSKVETGFAEQDYIGLSEVSSYSTIKQVGESGLGLKDTELELGLSLISSSGCGEKNGGKNGRAGSLQEEYCRVHMGGSGENQGTWGGWVPQERAARILTAKDFAPLVSRAVAGTKRVHTESVAGDAVQEVSSVPSSSQVVGWPPIRAYRINSLVNKTRVSAEDIIENNHNYEENNGKNKKNVQEKGGQVQGNSLFVKVNMDGIPIGRKVDLDAHVCYETLAQALEDMFQRPNTTNIRQSGAQSGMEKELGIVEAKPSKLLDGSSEFVLTYEDKEGDWMLVGDVPWGMFLSAVKRIRIMRTSEANGLGPTFQDKGNRQRSKACLA